MEAPTRLQPAPPPSDVDRTSRIDLSWTTAEAQQAYELTVERNTVGATVNWLKTDGTLAATQQQPVTASTSAYIAANTLSSYAEGYKWRVRFQNASNYWSPWSIYRRMTTAVSPPTVTITSPTAASSSNHPKVVWTYSSPSSYAQSAYRVKLYEAGSLLYDSYEVEGSDNNYVILGYTTKDWHTYTIGVKAKDSRGLWGPEATSASIPVNVIRPLAPTLTVTPDGANFCSVFVQANPVGKAVTSWDLYRWNPMTYRAVPLALGQPSMFSYQDTTTPHNADFWYTVLAHCDDGTTAPYNSLTVNLSDDDWYFVVGTTRYPITVQEYRADYEHSSEAHEPLGRSRPVVSKFTSRGRVGEMTCFVVWEERESFTSMLDTLLNTTGDILIKSPFGDVLNVQLGSPQTEELAGGSAVVKIPFVEVAEV